jgi:hypothetical protein
MKTYHFDVFGPQPQNGKNRTMLRTQYLDFLKLILSSFFPNYVSKNNPEECLFPEDGSYRSKDFYNDLCAAICFFCNGNLSENGVSIFNDADIKTISSERYQVEENQLFFTVPGFFFFFFFFF